MPEEDPEYPHGPRPDQEESSWYDDKIALIGHAGPYFPYDPDDPRAPVKEKRAPGFVTEDDYVQGGVVKQYKRRRPPKRPHRKR